jgi:hypothetical protein
VGLLLSLVFHPEMIDAGVEEWIVIMLEIIIAAAVLALIIFLLVPFLNDFFKEDGEAITSVNPT